MTVDDLGLGGACAQDKRYETERERESIADHAGTLLKRKQALSR